MTTVVTGPGTFPAEGAVLRRLSFRFSPHGGRAACLALDGRGEVLVEGWSFRRGRAEVRRARSRAADSVWVQPVPAQDGLVVVVRSARGVHEVSLVDLSGPYVVEHEAGAIEAESLRAFPAPEPGTLAMLVSYAAGRTVLHRLTRERIEQVMELPGTIGRVSRLGGDRLVVNQTAGDLRRLLVLDPRRGTATPFAQATGLVLLAAPATGEALIAAETPGGVGLGWLGPGQARPRFPAALNAITGTVLPLAADPAGRRLALRLTDGARSRVLVHRRGTDEVTELPVPPGVVGRTAVWTADGLNVTFSGPSHPPVVRTIATDRASPGNVGDGGTRGWPGARLERFDGPAGPLEAVVHGPDWRGARRLVIALHGGPEAAWDLGFDPTLQRLAAEGISVVAPNQRGSTGYGAAHRDAIAGRWGGPDLDDIRHLLVTVTAGRRDAPMLFGASYGAHLALLAAAADPFRWSRCVAVGPFLSGPRLYADGSPAVRALLDRLAGRTEIADDLGPRDLLRLCPRIRSPLLVVHGELDSVIPVAHSRALAARLRADGPPMDFRYVEVAGGEHYPLGERTSPGLLDEVVDFLLGRTDARRA
jgi:pimeloyl-ACP methyl ester carboxylesterase